MKSWANMWRQNELNQEVLGEYCTRSVVYPGGLLVNVLLLDINRPTYGGSVSGGNGYKGRLVGSAVGGGPAAVNGYAHPHHQSTAPVNHYSSQQDRQSVGTPPSVHIFPIFQFHFSTSLSLGFLGRLL